jgi:hypothetical protein
MQFDFKGGRPPIPREIQSDYLRREKGLEQA